MTGLRFFTVYGPWGRPDMAMYLFTRAIFAGEPIDVFNNGNMERDFTYVDDVVEALVRVGDKPAAVNPNWSGQAPDPATSNAPYSHLQHRQQRACEAHALDRTHRRGGRHEGDPAFAADAARRCARDLCDVRDLAAAVDFAPRTSIEDGVKRFVDWYKAYYGA